MSGFVKPKTEMVTAKDYILNLVNVNLRKDLHDNEEVCQYCRGTGLTIVDNRYGLSDDPNRKIGNLFPYVHQSISFCQHCYNGIVHRCPYCGNLIKRGRLKCDCDAQEEIERREKAKKTKDAFDNAPIAPKEVEKDAFYLYSNEFGNNEGYFSDWDEFFDYWAENHEPNDERPVFVWITEPVEMNVDATNIIASATEDLYEDAADDISSEARKELQDFIDDWCKRCGVGTTYYESHKYKVRIPWENYNK